MTKPKLLPCPFCGGRPKAVHSSKAEMHGIRCPHEGCVIVEVDESTFAEAARRWNRRDAPTTKTDQGAGR